MEQNQATPWTDEQLDALLRETLERKALTEPIPAAVMRDLRRAERRLWLKKWGRAAAFAFGLPLVAILFGWLLAAFLARQEAAATPLYICLVIPTAAMLYALWQAVENFSPDRL